MKKILIILVMVLALTLSGCGEKDMDCTKSVYVDINSSETVDYFVVENVCDFSIVNPIDKSNVYQLELEDGTYISYFVSEIDAIYYVEKNISGDLINYYTQEEVDDLLNTLCEDIFSRDYEDCITAHKDVQSIFEELDTELYTMRERTSDLLQRIIELEEPTIYTECNMIQLLHDILVVGTQGYTFEIDQYGTMYELKDDIYTGDTFTNEDLLDEFCTIENGDE